jgi:hypothetical protein
MFRHDPERPFPVLGSGHAQGSRQNLAPPPKANHCVRSYGPLVIG